MNARMDVPTVAAALFTITCWSLNFPVIRYALPAYEPVWIAVLRLVFGSLALGAYAAWVRLPLPGRRDVPAFAAFGLSGLALSSFFLAAGLQYVSAGAGSFLVGTIPIISALLAHAFLRERVGAWGWLGIGVSFAGVGLIGLGEGGLGRGAGTLFNPGTALVLASACCQSLFYVFQKPYHHRYSPLQITCYAVWAGTAFAVAFAAVFAPGLPAAMAAAPLGATLATVYLGVFPIAAAFVAWSYALSRARAAKVTSAMYAMPVLAMSVAWAWLGEVPTVLTVAGGVVALSGVAVLHLWGR